MEEKKADLVDDHLDGEAQWRKYKAILREWPSFANTSGMASFLLLSDIYTVALQDVKRDILTLWVRS